MDQFADLRSSILLEFPRLFRRHNLLCQQSEHLPPNTCRSETGQLQAGGGKGKRQRGKQQLKAVMAMLRDKVADMHPHFLVSVNGGVKQRGIAMQCTAKSEREHPMATWQHATDCLHSDVWQCDEAAGQDMLKTDYLRQAIFDCLSLST